MRRGFIYTIAGLIIMGIGEILNYVQLVEEVNATVRETQSDVIAEEVNRQLQQYVVVPTE
jgi:hypothetical protein